MTPGQRRAVIDLCSRAFEEEYEAYLETFADPVHVLACLDGELVSHALWITRWLQPGQSDLLRTAFVEGVATEPAYRRRGLARRVMQVLQEKIQDFQIGALAPFDVGWYQRLGWELWQGPLFARTAAGLQATPGEEAMILRLAGTPPLNLADPLSIEWRPGEVW